MALIVGLGWNANPESNISGYKLYVGRQSGVYMVPGSPISVGNVTSTRYEITADGLWFFTITAVNTSNLESGFSNEIYGSFSLFPTALSGTMGYGVRYIGRRPV